DDPDIDRRMEAQAALIWTGRRIELDTKAAVDLDLPLVVDPGNAEEDLPLRLANPFDQGIVDIFRMLGDDRAKTFQHLLDGLMKFRLTRISSQDFFKNRNKFLVDSG